MCEHDLNIKAFNSCFENIPIKKYGYYKPMVNERYLLVNWECRKCIKAGAKKKWKFKWVKLPFLKVCQTFAEHTNMSETSRSESTLGLCHTNILNYFVKFSCNAPESMLYMHTWYFPLFVNMNMWLKA